VLNDVVARHEVDHLGTELGRQRLDQLVLAVGLTAVANQPCQAHAAGIGILHNPLGDVVGGVHGHHFAGDDDVDFLCLVLADRHGETTAHHVPEHVVENEVEVFVVGAFFLEEVDGGNDPTAGAADTRLRSAGLDALDAAVSHGHYVLEFQIFDRTGFRRQMHDRRLGLAVQDQAGRVGFRVASDDHDLLARLGQRGDQILCCGRLADTTFAVNGGLTQFSHGAISYVCVSLGC